MDPDLRGNGSSGCGVQRESSMDAPGALTSSCRVHALVNQPAETELCHGGMCSHGAQMWEALFHVWSTLQSHLGEALYPFGR